MEASTAERTLEVSFTLSPEIKEATKKKNRLKREYLRTLAPHHKTALNRATNDVKD